MKKMGRPITGRGETLYIPKEILPMVRALKAGDKEKAISLLQNQIAEENAEFLQKFLSG